MSRRTAAGTRWGVVAGAVVLTAVAAVSGPVLPDAAVPAGPDQAPVVGRTLSVCNVPDGTSARMSTVVAQQAGAGVLTGTVLGRTGVGFTVDDAGAAEEHSATNTLVLQTRGSFGANSGGATAATAKAGPEAGVSTVPCLAPTSNVWFPGLAETADQSSTLVLTNPDKTQAVVDLHLFGPDGPVSAPGSLGIAVPKTSTRTIDLAGLLPHETKGPLAVHVSTSSGRVSALAHTTYRSSDQPAGAAWAMGQEAARTTVVIGAVPGGKGTRELTLANPGARRAQVTVEVLGADGKFAPADNPTVDVDAQSTAAVNLADALDGEPVSIRLTSTQPVIGAMVSTSTRKGAAPDVAVQAAGDPIRGVGLAPYAMVKGLANQLLVSNNADTPASAHVVVRDFDGKTLLDKGISVSAASTVTVELPKDQAGWLSIDTVADQVYAGVVQAQDSGDVAGLATSPVISAIGRRADTHTRMDPASGQ